MWKKLKKLFADRGNQLRYAKWIARQSKPYAGRLAILIAVKTAVVLFGVFSAAVNKLVIDRASASLGLAASFALLIGLHVLMLALNIALNVLSTLWTETFSYQIRNNIYDSILRSRWDALQNYHSEELLSRMTSDINAVTNGIVNIAVYLVSLVIQFVSAFLLLYYYDPSLAMFTLVLGPVATLASLFFGAKLKTLQVHLQQSEANYRVYLQEHLSHIPVLKAFCREADSKRGLDSLQKQRLHWIKKKNALGVTANAVISLSFSVGYLFAFISGVTKLADGRITYGTLSAFLSLVGQIQAPMMSLANTLPKLIAVLASAGRIMETDGLCKEANVPLPQTLDTAAGLGIVVKDLCFSYGSRAVFANAAFSVAPGAMVAVMGPSGAGKTTLIRLLLDYLHPQAGQVALQDQYGCRAPCSQATRTLISYVPQGNTLLSGSIRENLQMGCATADEADMERALRAADAWSFVCALPQGLDTVTGEGGAGLSEGQAQRLSIARALLRRAPVLLFDEATSALDEDTELRVLRQVTALPERPTCLFITHRSSVLAYCSQVLHVDNGKVSQA